MENQKLPDSFVTDRRLRSYPTEIGSQNFSPEDTSLFKLEKAKALKSHFTQKLTEIQKEYQNLISQISINERLYSAKINFQPVVGHIYFLYLSKNGEFISIISPEEWNNKFELIGKFQLLSDGRWEEVI
ncbi:MAG: DUF2452 domain-containing protein [Verrucomicrobia bacterium]|nr:DUF2452 domain-containing protein [Verrucomicrobiota bacterium]